MTWHTLVAAAMWWSSSWSGCLPIPASFPAPKSAIPKSAMIVPLDHWAYGALADLAAAGWEIPDAAVRSPGTLTQADFTTLSLRLASAAAARVRAGKPLPMAQRILVARLVAEFEPVVPPADAAPLPELQPEEVPSPKGGRLAQFVPTPRGAEIVVQEKATRKQTPVAVDGYNYGPTWSADGDEIAWLHFTNGRTEVWVHSMITGGEHLAGSALADGWGKLTALKEGFSLSMPGRPDRLIRIPALLEPENGAGKSDTSPSTQRDP